jgi:cell division protein ZipA
MIETIAILIALGALFAMFASVVRRKRRTATDAEARIVIGDVELVPETVSQDRARRVMPGKPSEDARRILVVPALMDPPDRDDNYPPDETVTWVVDVVFPEGTELSGKQVQTLIDQQLLRSIDGAMTHGLCTRTGKWTYVGAGGAPEPYGRIAIAKSLTRSVGDEERAVEATVLQHMLDTIRNRFAQMEGTIVSSTETPENASSRSKQLVRLKHLCGQQIVIALQAPFGTLFDGHKIWDVMASLGIEWGDMDLFHWRNPTESGDSYFFSVATSTSPGYFLPEEIAAGRVQTHDLLFAYEPARCSAPIHVFEQMLAAAEYTQSRLGGKLTDDLGHTLNADLYRRKIEAIARTLEAASFPPGASSTLMLF